MASLHLPRATPEDILRYRYQHGVNLGGVFVLEKWLFPSVYDPGAAGTSELDAVVSSITVRGLDATRERWERRWPTAVSAEDLTWLTQTAHCNMVRLPIGYFTLGPDFCTNTPFAMQVGEVYINAWSKVKELVARLFACGVGVLIDVHALSGGANGEIHSGTSRGQAELWGNSFNLSLATRCLVFIAEEVSRCEELKGVMGIQLCNEAQWEADGMYQWYDEVIDKIAEIDKNIPIYASDGWNLGACLEWAGSRNSLNGLLQNMVVVDTHRYYCFSENDKKRSPNELIEHVAAELSEVDANRGSRNICDGRGVTGAFVGEWSCVFAEESWKMCAGERNEVVKKFGHVQSHQWKEMSGGSVFWTWKGEWKKGELSGWDFVQQVQSKAVKAPPWLAMDADEVDRRTREVDNKRHVLMVKAVRSHSKYWQKASPGQRFEHWRFADGWQAGWTDARDFFKTRPNCVLAADDHERDGVGHVVTEGMAEGRLLQDRGVVQGGDKIGLLDLWVVKRMRQEMIAEKETDGHQFLWQWEHGFRQGIADFYHAVQV